MIAQEYLDGDVYSEVGQPFGVSHDPNSPAPTGDMSSVDPNATPTSSAYILQPPSSEGGSVNQQATSTINAGQATSLALTREEVIGNAAAATPSASDTPASAHDHTEDNDETIEANLHEFVEGVNSSDA